MHDTLLSVILVVQEAEATLAGTLARLSALLAGLVSDYEIIVVDNGSADGTVEVLQQAVTEHPNIQVYCLPTAGDRDVALIAGLENAIGDYVVLLDPTLDDPAILPAMLAAAVTGHDIVLARARGPAVESGALRRDLYFRLNVVRIDVPKLRDRRGDIALLANHFLLKHTLELGRAMPRLGPHVLQRLEAYEWPGNVRELENVMERAVVLCRGEEITLAHLPVELSCESPGRSSSFVTLADNPMIDGPLDMKARVEGLECRLIEAALERSANNKAAAARMLGISERTLWYKLKTYKVES